MACGTTSPTKPTMPHTATLAAVSSEVATIDDPLEPLDVGPEVARALLAEREEIERAAAGEHHGDGQPPRTR